MTIPFRLRGHEGHVSVECSVNEEPHDLGYSLLGLSYGPESARGFPVCRASICYPGEGYDAVMAWVQIVRYRAGGEEKVLVDTAPQLSEAQVPYYAWGVTPTFFDAPSMPRDGVVWTANTFLAASPDAVMSRVVNPVCGFRWGYAVEGGEPRVSFLTPVALEAWAAARPVLQERYSSWEFGMEWADERG